MTDESAKMTQPFWPSTSHVPETPADLPTEPQDNTAILPAPQLSKVEKSAANRLRERREKLERQSAKIARARAKLETTERKIETRRKILLGAWALKHLNDPALSALLKSSGPGFFTQPRDKEILADLLGD